MGDLIVAVNGVRFFFSTSLEIIEAFDWVEVGDRVELAIQRAELQLSLELVAAEMPKEVARRLESFREQVRQSNRLELLKLLASEGATVAIARSTTGEILEITAPGHPPTELAELEPLLRRTPYGWMFDKLRPGDHIELLFDWDDVKRKMHHRFKDVPAYLHKKPGS